MTHLRPLRSEDSEVLFRWRQREEVSRWMLSDGEITADGHRRWFDRVLADPSCRHFIIEAAEGPVGTANLTFTGPNGRDCDFGIYLGETEARGRGIGELALRQLLSIAFEAGAADTVGADVLEDNETARRMYQRLGFRTLGSPPRTVLKAGKKRSVLRIVLTRDAWVEMERRSKREDLDD